VRQKYKTVLLRDFVFFHRLWKKNRNYLFYEISGNNSSWVRRPEQVVCFDLDLLVGLKEKSEDFAPANLIQKTN
jgi:hypothetical protein